MKPNARYKVEGIAGSIEIHVSNGAEHIAHAVRMREVTRGQLFEACRCLLQDKEALHRCWHADGPCAVASELDFDDPAQDLIVPFRREVEDVLVNDLQDYAREHPIPGVSKEDAEKVTERHIRGYIGDFIMDDDLLKKKTNSLLVRALWKARKAIADQRTKGRPNPGDADEGRE